jgi:uncharacterized repeat protein (TIGR03803 family)
MRGNKTFGRASLALEYAILCVALIMVAAPAGALSAPIEIVLHAFTGEGQDGSTAIAGLIADNNGNLYGTTAGGGASGNGTVYELSPPMAGEVWTETVLYAFTGGSDGSSPLAKLTFDGNGNLYGTTAGGGASGKGTVFELSPPTAGGKWSLNTLYQFTGGSDGGLPSGVILASGNLYGMTWRGGASGKGTVFELSPPTAGGKWTLNTLYPFTGGSDGANPTGGLIMDSEGNLYGTTAWGGASGNGTVFELTPPAAAGGMGTLNTLYAFTGGSDGGSPLAGLTFGSKGNLYGTTYFGGASGFGTVFELTPPAATGGMGTLNTLHAFAGGSSDGANPGAGVTFDSSGNLYGTTTWGGGSCPNGGESGCGVVFELSPPGRLRGVVGWTETLLLDFSDNFTVGANPSAGLILDSKGNLYGTTPEGGVSCGGIGCGVVFELTETASRPTPPRICSNCRSPAICCVCAGGIWNGKQCS